MIDLSVVMVCWETRVLALESLGSLERELAGISRSSEIIVVDNGSCDDTVAAVGERFPGVQVISLPENRGFAVAANVGMARSAGRILLLLNSDARLHPGALEEVLRVFDARSEVGAAGVQLVDPEGRPQNSIHAFPGLATELLPRWLWEILAPKQSPSKRRPLTVPIDVEAVLGAVFFLRREALDAVGPLDEMYFFFLEETDWCWRSRRAGWRVVHVPAARAVHLLGASSKHRFPAATRIEYHRSLYRFLRTRRGPLTLAVVAVVRSGRVALGLVTAGILAPFSSWQRQRLADRLALAIWHLRGCPAGAGLRAVDVAARTRKDPRTWGSEA